MGWLYSFRSSSQHTKWNRCVEAPSETAAKAEVQDRSEIQISKPLRKRECLLALSSPLVHSKGLIKTIYVWIFRTQLRQSHIKHWSPFRTIIQVFPDAFAPDVSLSWQGLMRSVKKHFKPLAHNCLLFNMTIQRIPPQLIHTQACMQHLPQKVNHPNHQKTASRLFNLLHLDHFPYKNPRPNGFPTAVFWVMPRIPGEVIIPVSK